jgi:VRR-NUC domain
MPPPELWCFRPVRQTLKNAQDMTPNINFVFRSSQRDRFRSGELVREWRERHPQLFDERDEQVLRTAHQRRYNFYEWLAAVLMFESMGYLSLITKYTAKSHPSKHGVVRSCLPAAIADWVFENESGQPDLFVYSVSHQDWYFCEVKGPGDRVRTNQETWRKGFLKLVAEQKCDDQTRYRMFTIEEIDC